MVWQLVYEQRTSSMSAGAILFSAVDRMFDYLDVRMEERLELWTSIKEIDSIFVENLETKE